jgi:hypothetical protein
MQEPTFGQWIADHFYWLLFVPIIYTWLKLCIVGIRLHDDQPTSDSGDDGIIFWLDGHYSGSDYWGE